MERNAASGGAARQVELSAGSDGAASLGDTLIVAGSGGLLGGGFGTLRITNVTVADTPGATGIEMTDGGGVGTVSLANSIVWPNALSVDDPTVTSTHNLAGVDPQVSSTSVADPYGLQPWSPAIDAGTNTPPGGLGPFDARHATRVIGPTVDIGAEEFGGIFATSLEGGLSDWSSAAGGG